MDRDDELLRLRGLLGLRGGLTRAEEEAELSALSPATQALVLRRAEVLDRFLRAADRTTAMADAAAAQIGVSRSNFYRMAERYKSAGAVRGLTPHARVRPTRAAPEREFPFWVDQAIEKVLDSNPEARLADLIAAVGEKAKKKQVLPPPPSMLRNRASELRLVAVKPGRSKVGTRNAVFGRDLLVDQCALDEWVALNAYTARKDEPLRDVARALCTFVVDRDLRVIIGAGVAPKPASDAGLAGALCDADAFWSHALIGSAEVAPLPERITWVLPHGRERFGAAFVAEAERLGIVGEAVTAGERRHGARLIKLLGHELGPYKLLPRSTAKPLPLPEQEPKKHHVRHPGAVASTLAIVVDNWNYEVVRRREGARPTMHEPTRLKRMRDWTRADRLTPEEHLWLARLLVPSLAVDRLVGTWGVHEYLRSIEQPREEPVDVES